MKILVVLPSYNESGNILALIETILALGPNFYISVVDDLSPDGTARILTDACKSHPDHFSRVCVTVRPGKGGRGGAVREGLARGLERPEHFDTFVEMDCDFSHEPQAIPEGLKRLSSGAQVALGVRYPNGVIEGWPLSRRVFSFFANGLARCLMDRSIADYTNGFRFYTRRAVEIMLAKPQKHTGYIYLSESLVHLMRAGCRIETFPIVFRNRVRGVSNTTLREIRNALQGLFQIAWDYRFGSR